MQVAIRYEVVDCAGVQDAHGFVNHEHGLDAFADAILALLWVRDKLYEQCGEGARVISVEVSVAECEPDERTPGQPPGVHLAYTWAEPGVDLAE